MSVTQFPTAGAEPDGSDGWASPAPGDRTPPQDNDAEQSVLGAMLLSKDAIADVIETVRGLDFYRPAHETLFDAILDLYGRGEPADAVTVSAELQRRGELTRVGGAPYLHTLVAGVPIAANANYYAEIVREKAILRRLVDVGTKIAQLGYGGQGQVDDVVDRAQAEVYGVTERRASEDFAPLSEIIPATLEEIEAIEGHDGTLVGVPTGFTDLDALTNGLHPGQMVIVAARPSAGKALSVDTELATPTGWTTMGDARVGDLLLGDDGRPTRVVAATEVMTGRPCYEVYFSDGGWVVADGEHQWLTETRAKQRSLVGAAGGSVTAQEVATTVLTTEQIATRLRDLGDERSSQAVRNAAPLRLSDARLPIPPYEFGAQLVRRGRNPFDRLRIPQLYLRASEMQRRAVLAGVLDAAGNVMPTGRVQVVVPDLLLASGLRELVVSLGYACTWTLKERRGRSPWTSTIEQILTFTASDDVFRHPGKLNLHRSRRSETSERAGKRFITGVRRVESVPVRCVQVDNESHLYLAGPSMIPTHNSTLALDLCRSASLRHGLASVIFSLEMNRTEITMRLLSAEAKIALHSMRNGKMNEDDWARLARRMAEVSEAPLFIDDSPNMTMMKIRAKARRLKQRHDLRLIVVDYLQLMTSGRRVESRQVEVSEFSRQMKLLAKELEVPVVAVSQLNRGAEQRTDKRPLLSDLRESGCLTAGTRLLRADNGAEITLGELLSEKSRDVPVWSLDDRLKLVPRTLTHAFSSGTKPTYRVRLGSGREVEATANHPFLTIDGWTRLDRLAAGDRMGVLRHAPAPLEVTRWSDDNVVRAAQGAARHHCLPAPVFGLPKRQVALFVRHLWAPYGSIDWDGVNGEARIRCGWPSRRLADDVARLLLRVNVLSHITERPGRNGRPVWQLSVPGIDNQKRFCDEVWAPGTAGRWVKHVQNMLADVEPTTDLVTIPPDVWARVVDALRAPVGSAPSTLGFHPSRGTPAATGRTRLAGVAAVLDDRDVDVVATNDVFWDEIVAIDDLGEQPVFDATVIGTHNFVANGIALHNSLEQDADLVILLHREDMYERESTRPGEADVIVAKHRAGPTSTVVVAFQGHYSRFVDMQHI